VQRTALIGCLLLQIVNLRAADGPQVPAADSALRFDTVSVKRSVTTATNAFGLPQSSMKHLPDGGFVMVNRSIDNLVYEAYSVRPFEVIGMPAWVSMERYDVSATGPVPRREPTADQRRSMLRAMLAERFKLVAHDEAREEPSYDLVLARSDGRLGPQIKKSPPECEAQLSVEFRDSSGTTNPPCGPHTSGDLIDGDWTMDNLGATMLRIATGRYVVNKTGLTGYFRITANFERAPPTPSRPQRVVEAPSVFVALPEQLGLKLQPSRASVKKLVIDRLDRPSAN